MATANTKYSSNTGTAFTITLASLGSFAAREATAISNTTNLYLDVQISGKIAVGAAAATGNCYVLVGGYDGNNYPWGGTAVLTGSDAGVTMNALAIASLEQMQFGQILPGTGLLFGAKVPTAGVAAATLGIAVPPFNISALFQAGGLDVPQSFTIVVVNCQGQALDATAAHFAMYYTGITQTIA